MNLWSDLPLSHLPQPGDRIRRCSHPAALSVAAAYHDAHGQYWCDLSDGSSERVECLQWQPQEGDKVTLHIARVAKGITLAMAAAEPHSAALAKLQKASQDINNASSWMYRSHSVVAIAQDRVTIEDSKGQQRSVKLENLVVTLRAEQKQLALSV